MVVVMQTFAAGEPGNQAEVGGGILEILVADSVAGAIDDRIHADIRGTLHDKSDNANDGSGPAALDGPEQGHEHGEPHRQAEPTAAEHSFGGGARDVTGVLFDHVRLIGFARVVKGVEEQYLP